MITNNLIITFKILIIVFVHMAIIATAQINISSNVKKIYTKTNSEWKLQNVISENNYFHFNEDNTIFHHISKIRTTEYRSKLTEVDEQETFWQFDIVNAENDKIKLILDLDEDIVAYVVNLKNKDSIIPTMVVFEILDYKTE